MDIYCFSQFNPINISESFYLFDKFTSRQKAIEIISLFALSLLAASYVIYKIITFKVKQKDELEVLDDFDLKDTIFDLEDASLDKTKPLKKNKKENNGSPKQLPVVENLNDLEFTSSQLKTEIKDLKDLEIVPDPLMHSGIENTCNSCYCAAALQIIAHTKVYLDALHPQNNSTVGKKKIYARSSNEELKVLQMDIYNFMTKILRGDPLPSVQGIRKRIAENLLNKTGPYEAGDSTCVMDFILEDLADIKEGYQFSVTEIKSVGLCDANEKKEIYEELTRIYPYKDNFISIMSSGTKDNKTNFLNFVSERILKEEDEITTKNNTQLSCQRTIQIQCLNPEIPLVVVISPNAFIKGRKYCEVPLQWDLEGNGSVFQLESALLSYGGHATALVRRPDGSFVYFNDSRVTAMNAKSAQELMEERAVRVFYKKIQ